MGLRIARCGFYNKWNYDYWMAVRANKDESVFPLPAACVASFCCAARPLLYRVISIHGGAAWSDTLACVLDVRAIARIANRCLSTCLRAI